MKKKREFNHINRSMRLDIEILLSKKYLQKDIALVLKVNPSSVSREIKMGKDYKGIYRAEIAQRKADENRRNSKYQGMKVESNKELKDLIIKELEDKQSPDGIAGRYGVIGKDAIYKWLYSPFGQQYCKYLCTKRYKKRKQKKKTERVMIPDRISIDLRPNTGIHAEFDTFVNKKKFKDNTCVSTITEPQSKLMTTNLISSLETEVMKNSVNHMLESIKIDTLTSDNGIENRKHKDMNIDVYFCDPHSPWQKPHVENNIGLLRKWFVPKSRNLGELTQVELDKYTNIINSKYRKSLGYLTAYEKAFESGIIEKIPCRDY